MNQTVDLNTPSTMTRKVKKKKVDDHLAVKRRQTLHLVPHLKHGNRSFCAEELSVRHHEIQQLIALASLMDPLLPAF